jgi:hypothetical protein
MVSGLSRAQTPNFHGVLSNPCLVPSHQSLVHKLISRCLAPQREARTRQCYSLDKSVDYGGGSGNIPAPIKNGIRNYGIVIELLYQTPSACPRTHKHILSSTQ